MDDIRDKQSFSRVVGILGRTIWWQDLGFVVTQFKFGHVNAASISWAARSIFILRQQNLLSANYYWRQHWHCICRQCLLTGRAAATCEQWTGKEVWLCVNCVQQLVEWSTTCAGAKQTVQARPEVFAGALCGMAAEYHSVSCQTYQYHLPYISVVFARHISDLCFTLQCHLPDNSESFVRYFSVTCQTFQYNLSNNCGLLLHISVSFAMCTNDMCNYYMVLQRRRGCSEWYQYGLFTSSLGNKNVIHRVYSITENIAVVRKTWHNDT